MITLNIDVTKINKTRLFKGAKGTYLDVVVIETPNSQYNDFIVKQSVSKEEREQGIEGVTLGSGKNWDKKPVQANQKVTDQPPSFSDEVDDLPF